MLRFIISPLVSCVLYARISAWFAIWQNPPVDREVLERFRLGDEAAVKAVYDRYGGPVFALSMSILGEHGLAADATQQTFIKAWRAASTYDAGRSSRPGSTPSQDVRQSTSTGNGPGWW